MTRRTIRSWLMGHGWRARLRRDYVVLGETRTYRASRVVESVADLVEELDERDA